MYFLFLLPVGKETIRGWKRPQWGEEGEREGLNVKIWIDWTRLSVVPSIASDGNPTTECVQQFAKLFNKVRKRKKNQDLSEFFFFALVRSPLVRGSLLWGGGRVWGKICESREWERGGVWEPMGEIEECGNGISYMKADQWVVSHVMYVSVVVRYAKRNCEGRLWGGV